MKGNFCFPKKERLYSSSDIRWVLETGTKRVSPSIILFFRKQPGLDLRSTFVTSKKIGSAVRRNRIKRLMREAFRLQKHLFDDDLWLVFIAKSFSLQKEWIYEKIFSEIGLLAKKPF